MKGKKMNYDIFMCNGCKKNLFKKDRCTCLKYSDDEQTLIFNMFFVSASVKARAISFCIDKLIDGISEKKIFEDLRETKFDIEKRIQKEEKSQEEENIKMRRNILGEYVIKYKRTK